MDGAVYVLAFLITILVFVFVRGRKKNASVNKVRTQLINLHKREAVYLCTAVEDLGDSLIQFYGEPVGSSARPGMTISDLSGEEYKIKEVYDSDSTPSKPNPEILSGNTNTAIVIEARNFNFENCRQNIKRDGMIALKLR